VNFLFGINSSLIRLPLPFLSTLFSQSSFLFKITSCYDVRLGSSPLCPTSPFERTPFIFSNIVTIVAPFLACRLLGPHYGVRVDRDERNNDGFDSNLGDFKSRSRILEFRKLLGFDLR